MSKRALDHVKEYYLEDPSRAVVEGLKLIEDDETVHTVGRFAYPNEEGYLQLDAAYMEGDSRVGAVVEADTLVNPIEVARDLSRFDKNIVLAGKGADIYAAENGFKTSPKLECASSNSDGHDTFGMIILNDDHFYLGVTTSGRNGKHVGRVGDSALTGAGYYCEDGVGACIATGDGEAVLRNALSKEVVDHMLYGADVETALKLAGSRALARLGYDADFCMIAMDHEGNYSAYSSSSLFPFATMDDSCVSVHYVKDGDMYDDDGYLEENYRGD